jgi:hypothetical protein
MSESFPDSQPFPRHLRIEFTGSRLGVDAHGIVNPQFLSISVTNAAKDFVEQSDPSPPIAQSVAAANVNACLTAFKGIAVLRLKYDFVADPMRVSEYMSQCLLGLSMTVDIGQIEKGNSPLSAMLISSTVLAANSGLSDPMRSIAQPYSMRDTVRSVWGMRYVLSNVRGSTGVCFAVTELRFAAAPAPRRLSADRIRYSRHVDTTVTP